MPVWVQTGFDDITSVFSRYWPLRWLKYLPVNAPKPLPSWAGKIRHHRRRLDFASAPRQKPKRQTRAADLSWCAWQKSPPKIWQSRLATPCSQVMIWRLWLAVRMGLVKKSWQMRIWNGHYLTWRYRIHWYGCCWWNNYTAPWPLSIITLTTAVIIFDEAKAVLACFCIFPL